jgi:hypothetical protein
MKKPYIVTRNRAERRNIAFNADSKKCAQLLQWIDEGRFGPKANPSAVLNDVFEQFMAECEREFQQESDGDSSQQTS